MKNIKLLAMILLISNFTEISGQCNIGTCEQNVCSEFSKQLCWFKNQVCFDFYIPKRDKSYKIGDDSINRYTKYNVGSNSIYLDKKNTAWGGNWFACQYGGIGRKWQISSETPYSRIEDLKWDNIKNMSANDLALLSPAEKLDVFLGYADFRISSYELKLRGPYRQDQSDNGWCGFCNGSRAAGALLSEPVKSVTVKSKADNNISITFYPADIKALAGASYNYTEDNKTIALGTNLDPDKPKCDPSPAMLDIILRMYLGQYKLPFFLDSKDNGEKWNETVLGYDRTIVKKANPVAADHAPQGTMKVITINVSIYAQDEVPIVLINKPTLEQMANKEVATKTLPGWTQPWVKTIKVKYKLFVDQNNKIIDGVWIEGALDYIWIAAGRGVDELHSYSNQSEVTKGYNGNKYLSFDAILELVKLSAN
jgi:hypothetical protein